MTLVRRILLWLTFWRTEQAPRRPRQASRGKDIEATGRWYYLRDILDKLDEYSRYLSRMRTGDPDGFDLYRGVGGFIVNQRLDFSFERRLPANWNAPGFACVYSPFSDNSETVGLRFGYFRKTERPSHVAIAPGDIYYVCAYYDDGSAKGWLYYYVSVSDSQVRVLRSKNLVARPIPTNSQVYVPQARWSYPRLLTEQACDKGDTPQEWGAWMFCIIAQLADSVSADIYVRCERKGLAALFCVDLLRTPYFFKDRDTVVNHNGRKRRIFHIVRTHTRKNGTVVKSHFRGLRHFTWNGYKVSVSMPGKHHAPLSDFGGATTEADDLPSGYISLAEGSRKIGQHIGAA